MAKVNVKQLSPGLHKFIHHLGHIDSMIKGEVVAPIHVSVWPTIKCQLKCSYCCCRNISTKEGELNISDFKSAVDVLKKYGTKAIEFSGGGEPLLWSHFSEAVEYVYNKGIKLSLISNGLALSKNLKKTLAMFSWIRISLISIKHAKSINFEYIPTDIRVSASYILPTESDLSIIKDLFDFAKRKPLTIRIALQRPSVLKRENEVQLEVNRYGEPLFFSEKEAGSPLGCYMAWVRAAIDWKGNFLPCPSMQLNCDSEGKIPETFALCNIKNLEKWLIDNRTHDLGYKCKFCNCGKEHNDFIYNLFKGVEDVEFV